MTVPSIKQKTRDERVFCLPFLSLRAQRGNREKCIPGGHYR